MYTLVIVDMQPCFIGDKRQYVIEPVIAEIEQAKLDGAYIILLEYRERGHTHDAILSTIGDYPMVSVVTKKHEDGGHELHDFMYKRDLDMSQIRLCGLHWHHCVRETALTLAHISKNADIIGLAYASDAYDCDWLGDTVSNVRYIEE